MSLRLRLLLGYGYLVALLLVSTGSAMLGFLHLSETVDVILEENVGSIRSAMEMVEALERQDSMTLAGLIEGRVELPEMERHEESFLAALTAAEGNVTEGPEVSVLARVRGDYETYREARDELLAAQPERPLRAYNSRVFPAFSRVKADVLELLDVNHRAMIEADQETRESAVRNGSWLGMLVAVALVSLVLLSRALQRHVLVPLARLRDGMSDIAGGDLGRRLNDREGGELGTIAGHFNTLLDRLQRIEARLQGRMRHERQVVLALAGRLGEEVGVYDLAGRRLVGRGGLGRDLGPILPPEALKWIEERGVEEPGAEQPGEGETGPAELEVEGRLLTIELLSAPPGRPVGWLLRPAG